MIIVSDPRFPVPITAIHCSAFNARARTCVRITHSLIIISYSGQCLDQVLNSIGDFQHVDSNTQLVDDYCECKQSCHDRIFEASFSAAKWPSSVRNVCLRSLVRLIEIMTIIVCWWLRTNEWQRMRRILSVYDILTTNIIDVICSDNAVLVEIYYERLSTDYLKETEAYGVGCLLLYYIICLFRQLIWLPTLAVILDCGLVGISNDKRYSISIVTGCSIITLMELFALLFNLGSLCFKRQTKQQQRETSIASTNDYQM
jgi:hypothetical protein